MPKLCDRSLTLFPWAYRKSSSFFALISLLRDVMVPLTHRAIKSSRIAADVSITPLRHKVNHLKEKNELPARYAHFDSTFLHPHDVVTNPGT